MFHSASMKFLGIFRDEGKGSDFFRNFAPELSASDCDSVGNNRYSKKYR